MSEKVVYKHYKGGLYSLIGFGTTEADLTPVAMYRCEATGKIWVRPEMEFHEKFMKLESVKVIEDFLKYVKSQNADFAQYSPDVHEKGTQIHNVKFFIERKGNHVTIQFNPEKI